MDSNDEIIYIEDEDEDLRLQEELGVQAFTHEALEGKIAEKAEAEMLEKEAKLSEKQKQKEAQAIQKLEKDANTLQNLIKTTFGTNKAKYEKKLEEMKADLDLHRANIVDIDRRLQQSAAKAYSYIEATSSNSQRKGESRRDYLIRKGLINPFTADSSGGDDAGATPPSSSPTDEPPALSFQHLRAPGFAQEQPRKVVKKSRITLATALPTSTEISPEPPARKTPPPALASPAWKASATADQKVSGFEDDYEQGELRAARPRRATKGTVKEEVESPRSEVQAEESDDYKDEGEISEGGEEEEEEGGEDEVARPAKKAKAKAKGKVKVKQTPKKRRRVDDEEEEEEEEEDLREFDDGYESVYQKRIKAWCAKRSAARGETDVKEEEEEEEEDNPTPEWFKPSPSAPDFVVDEGFKLPGDIAQSLFDYQKTAVNWLWNLHAKQHTGGILGDEMGLGKTIQTIAFLAGLHYTQRLTKPVLVVAPATVLKQWCNEFHKWWPPLRVSILHSSGSGMLSIAADKRAEEGMYDEDDILEVLEKKTPTKSQKAAKKIVDKVKAKGHVLISTYTGLSTYQKLLLDTEWECVVLDEGHRIRNPEAKITIAAKQLRSSTRFILSGTPIQNNLKELWSLFDFVYPGKLGIYQVFNEHIATPIRLGGYSGASNLQIHAAFKCAVVLREMIGPYILRRLKADVAVLPPKQDQVLFCNLVKEQKEAYETYIKSPEASAIFAGRRDVLAGIDVLRKICNHPDLCNRDKLSASPKYGNPVRSGKMQIVKGLLKSWEKDKLKCLIFSQGTQMLDILETFVKNMRYAYLRMDGGTDIKTRQNMVDRFNGDPELQVFLLTTRVGGYGLNLTGATRIIIFDPDWNPSNDMQARERSWRLGQKHEVRIYRLLSRGTIEEKIYQRQLYKQFLTKKILEDPEQRRVFKMDDMQDLFTLGSLDHGTETGSLFAGVERTLEQAKTIVDDKQSEEVQAITGVDRLENFVGGASNILSGSMTGEAVKSEEKSNDSPVKETGKGKTKKSKEAPKDDHLLDSILAKAGVHSIVQHDEIMASSKSSSEIIEREANRVASAAREALKRSFDSVRKFSVPGQVVWTGRPSASGTKSKGKLVLTKGRDLMKAEIVPAIRQWFTEQQQKKKQVTTKMITDVFNPMLTQKLEEYFKVALKENAEFLRGEKCWRLKPARLP
ncbi:hypothetical protein ABW20_dc0101714 [Dactylellina cionopaga]|nr:hypothetical protein ABW20_dc0101714 [Dactylellina cionopaga]